MINSKGSERNQGASRRLNRPTRQSVKAAFVACGRCGYFLSGYGLIHADLNEAIENCDGLFLDLTWNGATRRLVNKIYGCDVDQNLDHFDGLCPECLRSFSYRAASETGAEPSFTIRIMP